MQLVPPKYYQLNHPTEKNDWVLLSEKAQEQSIVTDKPLR